MKDLNERPKIIKLEEKGSELTDVSLGNDFFPFLDLTPEAQVRLNQTKKSCTAKKTINKMKRQPLNGGKYLQIRHLVRS